MAEGEGSEKESVPWWQVEINPVPEWFRRHRLNKAPRMGLPDDFVDYPRGRKGLDSDVRLLSREEWQGLLKLRDASRRMFAHGLSILTFAPHLLLQLSRTSPLAVHFKPIWITMLIVFYGLAIGLVYLASEACNGADEVIPWLRRWYAKRCLVAFLFPFGGAILGIAMHRLVSREVRRHGLRVFPFESTQHALDELLAEQERMALSADLDR